MKGTLKAAFILIAAFLLSELFQFLGVEVSQELVMSIATALAAWVFGNDEGEAVHARFVQGARG